MYCCPLCNALRCGQSRQEPLARVGIRGFLRQQPGARHDKYRPPLADLFKTQADRTGEPIEKLPANRAGTAPLDRFGEIDEFGKAGAFLLPDAASYITGEALVVYGSAMKTLW